MGARTGVLLYWLHVICAFALADVWKAQLEHEMEALVSSCVVLPCSFKYPGPNQPTSRMRGVWHKKDNWDKCIYHEDHTKIEDNFKDRTRLVGRLGDFNCSLEIDEVKNHDNGPFCFRVELQTSVKDKYSFVEDCVSIKMIERPQEPHLQYEESVHEGVPAVYRCSVRHTCPSHQPNITWSHTGKAMVSYKDIGHGNWEVESILTFTPTKEDDHGQIICTVTYHKVSEKKEAACRIFVKEQSTLSHILIPTISGVGAALLVGGLCFFMVRRYKKRIQDLQNRHGSGIWNRLSRMSRRFRSGESSSEPRGRDQRRSIWSRFSRRGQGNQMDRNFDNRANNTCAVSGKPCSKPRMPSPKSEHKSCSGYNYDDDYTNTADLNVYGNT